MKQTVNLTEADLHRIINQCVNEALENEISINQLKTGAKTFFGGGNKGRGLKDRLQNAKKNYNLQGEYDNMQSLINQLSQFVDSGQIDPNTTIAQLVGGKYNGGKFGKMTGKMNNRMSQMRNNGLRR